MWTIRHAACGTGVGRLRTGPYVCRVPPALLCCLAAALALAAPASAGTLTLNEAVDLALEQNLSLAAARADYEAANWGSRSAWAALFPSVSLSSTAMRVDPDTYARANASLGFAEEMGIEVEPFLYETTYETRFTASMPIFNSGRLWGAVGMARASRDAALHGYEATIRDVEVATKAAYFGVLRAEALLDVSRDAVSAAERRVETARRKSDIGLIGRAELLRWEVELANAEKSLADARGGVIMARTQLSNVLGLPLDSHPELVDVNRAELDARCEQRADLLTQKAMTESDAREALAANPAYRILADATRISGSGLTVARGAFLPALNASASYGWKADDDIEPDDERAWTATLALELPIFTGFKNLSDYQQSKRSHLAAVRRQEDAERSMVAGLRNAIASLRSLLEALDAAERLAAQSSEYHKNMAGRYEQGMVSHTDLAEARVLYDRSRSGQVNALYDCFVGLAELESLVGQGPAPREKGNR